MRRRVAIGCTCASVLAALALPAAASADITATEGQSFSGKVVDVDQFCGLSGTPQIDWGDGTTSAADQNADTTAIYGTHTYAEEGTYSGSATYTCAQFGTMPTTQFQATVADAALTGTGRDISGTAGQSLTGVVAHIDDANPAASPTDFSAQIDWGDGATSAGTVAASAGGGFDVTGTHTYATAGRFTVGTSITDTGGSSATATSMAQIAQPTPGGSPPVAHFRVTGNSKTLKGGVWLTGIDSKVGAGRSIIDYAWSTDGSRYTPCGPSPIASMTFLRAGLESVYLRVTDNAGKVSVFHTKVRVRRPAVNSQTPMDCENPAAGGNQPSTADCVKVFAWSIVEVGSRGGPGDCFKLDQLLDKGPLTPIHYGAGDRAHAGSIPQLFVYSATITGPVAINGLYVPVPSGNKTFYNSLDSTVGVGSVSLSLGPLGSEDLNLSLKVKPVKIPAGGCYSRAMMGYPLPTNGLLKGDTKIAGLPIGGSLAVDLLYRSSRITAMVSLPNIFKLSNDAPAQGTVCLNADNTHGVSFEGIKIFIPAAMIGPVELQNLSFTYLKTQNVLSGGATVILFPGGPGLNASPPPPDQGFGLKNGKFDHAGLDFIFPVSAQPVLYPGIFLSHIGVAIGVNPVRFTGQVGVNAAKVIAIDGDVFVVFASSDQPYDYPTSDGPLAPLSGKTFNTFALAVAGQAKLTVPSLGEIALANGFLLYEYPDYFQFGGGFDFRYSFLHVTSSISGFVDPTAGLFNFEGKLDACVGTVKIKIWFVKHTFDLCISAGGVISSNGIGVCAPIPVLPFISVTIGYVWGDGPHVKFFSCDFGPYEVQATRARDRGARDPAGEPPGFRLPGRLAATTIRLTGASAPPDAIVTAPDGTRFSTAQHTPSNDVVVMQIPGSNQTFIGIRHPRAGRWSVVAAPGSVPIAELAVAESLPNPGIVASVRLRGRRATLRYRLTVAPGRQVVFAERGTATARAIGTAHGNHGTIDFTPGDGPAGRRQILALITEHGTPVRDVVLTTYAAPGPLRVGTPRHIHATRSGRLLRIAWSAVPGAAGYATTISLSNGDREMLYSRRAIVVFPHIDPALHGTIAVLALGVNGTRGAVGRGRIQSRHPRRHRRR